MSAIVPYQPPEIARRRRSGAATVLQFASGGVVADVHVERVERRNRCSWYALKLAAGDSDVTGRLIGIRRGRTDELGSVVASRGSMTSARFAVTTPRSGAYESLYLELRSGELALRVEAPRPPVSRAGGVLKSATALIVLGIGAAVAGATPLAFAHQPHHAAPALAVAARFPQPKLLAYAAPAGIQSFSATRDAAPGGRESVLASYLAIGERGTISLLDAEGTIVSSAPFARVGTVRLPVPRAYHALPMTAQIVVRRGETKAVSRVDVPPLAAPAAASPAPSPSASPRDGDTPAATAALPASGDILSIVGAARAGTSLVLRLAPQTTPMRVELEDQSGATIAETQVAAGTARASLPLPAAAKPVTYLIALHYERNGGEETVIRTVVAAPR